MAPNDRKLLGLALQAALDHLDGNPVGLELAHVLAAAHHAFLGKGGAQARKALSQAARKVLADAVDRDATGAASYAAAGYVIPLSVGPDSRPVDRARYIRGRAELALAAGESPARVARDVAAATEHVWPASHAAASKISRDEHVLTAIDAAEPEAIVKAALRAAGLKFSRNLFSADDQRLRRSKR